MLNARIKPLIKTFYHSKINAEKIAKPNSCAYICNRLVSQIKVEAGSLHLVEQIASL